MIWFSSLNTALKIKIACLFQERRRLKERYPSLALVSQDEEQCRLMLSSYQSLILSRDLCEGDCAMGQTCPTGMCRGPNKRYILNCFWHPTQLYKEYFTICEFVIPIHVMYDPLR